MLTKFAVFGQLPLMKLISNNNYFTFVKPLNTTIMKQVLITLLAVLLFSSCTSVENNAEILSKNNLSSKVEYGDRMVTKTVFDSHYKMIVFALKKGQDLAPHSAPMDAPLLMLEGSAKITIGTKETIVSKGDIITLPKDLDHGVTPVTDCKFLLIK